MSESHPPEAARGGLSEHTLERAQLAVAALALAVGGVLAAVGLGHAGRWLWLAATLVVLVPALITSVRGLLRGETGVDLVAVLAMAGAAVLGEWLAGAIIALMLSGGASLERYAVGRARRELTALLERAPRVAHRLGADGALTDLAVSEVVVGDRLLVKPGEVLPVDGMLESDAAVLDESALTGESRPVDVRRGMPVRSGATNSGAPLELRVTASAADSTYAGIVRLVKAAEASRAPFVRLADRFALGFLFLTLAVAGGAWLWSGDLVRALAVLVVATPCPLILAAPAAIVAGVSQAARHGVIVKGGGPLETLAGARTLLLDKTGTITAGRPRVVAVELFSSAPSDLTADELLRLAASLEQLSTHPYAPSIVAEAHARSLAPGFPQDAEEALGTGIRGRVDGLDVALGQLSWVCGGELDEAPQGLRSVQVRTAVEGSASVFVALEGVLVGALVLHDPIRSEAPRALRELRAAGIARIEMVTGDRGDIAELVGEVVGVDKVHAERSPDEKVRVVESARQRGVTVMVGDGVNDAPALALADVGVAMGARGATVASEAADVVLTADRLEGLVAAVRIAQRTRRIALQSVIAGMALSGIAMIAAAAGYLAPVVGALVQEAIDVAVLANALRALRGGVGHREPPRATRELAAELALTHRELRPRIEALAALASRLESMPREEARSALQETRTFLEHDLLAHERDEQARAYPLVAQALRGQDPTGPLVHTHREIARLVRLFGRRLDEVPGDGPQAEDLRELRRALYGLHAVLTLHFAQEEEVYAALT